MSFTDRILDYIEGGPKLRKWYGAPDKLPTDGGVNKLDDEGIQEDGSPEGETEIRDAVFVTDGDSEIGQMVILSLILKRIRTKALVKDKRAAVDAFGVYVEPVSGDVNSKSFLRGVRAIICPSNEGFLSEAEEQMTGIEHIVLLSQLEAYKGGGGFQAFLNSSTRKLAEKDEQVVIASGIPYTIIQAGTLQDSPGGAQGFNFEQGVASKGQLSKEDAAGICVEVLQVVPQKGMVFEVANGEEKILDWKQMLTSMTEKNQK